MAGFDDPGVYYSDSLFSEDRSESLELTRTAAQKRLKDFIKTFIDHQNCFCYRYYKQLFLINTSCFDCRDQLKRHYNLRQYWLEVDLQDLASFDAQLAEKLSKVPAEYLPLVRRTHKNIIQLFFFLV